MPMNLGRQAVSSDVLTSETESLALDLDISLLFRTLINFLCLTGLALLMQYVVNPFFGAWTKIHLTNCP